MTVEVNDTIERYTISGVGPYAFSFRIFADTDLQVTACSTASPPIPQPLTLLTHYTVSGANDEDGGSVTLTSGAASTYAGYTLDIRSNTAQEQPTSVRNQGRFLPEIHEDAFDRLCRQVQDLSRKVDASVHIPDDEMLSGEAEPAETRKGRYLFWDTVTGAISSALSLTGTVLSQSIFETFYFLTDDKKRTAAEISAGVTPVNYAYPPGHVDRYGTNTTPGITDMASAIQAALDVLLNSGETVTFKANTLYRSNSALTMQRSSASHATEMLIEGNGATITFPAFIGGTVGLTVGATSTTYFLEVGSMLIRNLYLLGPETGSAIADDPDYTNTGLLCSIAGRVELQNIQVRQFYTGIRTTFTFPLTAINVSARNNWIGLHCDEVSNLQSWFGLQTPNCRYGILIKSTTTSFDDGKTNQVTFNKWWPEGSLVGCVVDSGAGGSGASRFRNFKFIDPYISGITYDVFRLGTQFTFSTPDTRGSNCSEFIHEFSIEGGLWNPATGAWTATSAAIAYDSATRVRHVDISIGTVSDIDDDDLFVNSPAGGTARTYAYPGVSDGVVKIITYYNDGSTVRRLNPAGDIMIGSSKIDTGTISQAGVDLRSDGSGWFTASDAPPLRLNRQTSVGTLAAFYQADTQRGSVDVTSGGIELVLDSVNDVKLIMSGGSPEGSITAGIGSLALDVTNGVAYMKKSGTGNTGWKLITQAP